MKKKNYLVLALAALVPAIAIAAQHHHVPGSICLSPYGTNDDVVMNTGATMIVWGSLGVQVGCAVPFTATSSAPLTVNPSAYRVDYSDQNAVSNIFAGGAVACQLSIVTNTGLTVSSGWRYSCATAGGCTSGENAFVGTGYLSGPDTIAATANTVGMGFICNVPGYETSASTLLGLAASTSAP